MKIAQMTLQSHLDADSPYYISRGITYDLEYYLNPRHKDYVAVIVTAYRSDGSEAWEAQATLLLASRVIDAVRQARDLRN